MNDARASASEASADRGRLQLPLTDQDRQVLENVEVAYAEGLALKAWWDDISSRDAFTRKFQLVKEFHKPDFSFGYIEDSPVGPVMGEGQSFFYDRPKVPPNATTRELTAEWVNRQMREWVLRYFVRNLSSRASEAYPEAGDPAPCLGWLSQCPRNRDLRRDIGFYQKFYREKGGGATGRFPEDAEQTFVDVREIGTRYDWVVAKARLLDFRLTFHPLGRHAPPLVLIDHNEHLWVLFTPYFNCDRENPEKGVLGEYGMGFSIIRPPVADNVFTFGPQVFHYGFNYFRFRVFESGLVRASVVFCCNQLDGILPLPVSPVDWAQQLAHLATFGVSSRLLGRWQNQIERLPLSKATIDPVFNSIELLNFLTGDALARDYCISKEEIFKFILRKHATVFQQLISDSVRIWRQVPDWLDAAALPRWVAEGEKPPSD